MNNIACIQSRRGTETLDADVPLEMMSDQTGSRKDCNSCQARAESDTAIPTCRNKTSTAESMFWGNYYPMAMTGELSTELDVGNPRL